MAARTLSSGYLAWQQRIEPLWELRNLFRFSPVCRGLVRTHAAQNRCILPPDLSPSPVRILPHGAHDLRSVHVDNYNVELRDGAGFLGDRANKKAFQTLLDKWRSTLGDADPLRDISTQELYKQKPALEKILLQGDPLAAGVLLGAIEDFSHSLCEVIARFLKLAAWRDTQRIVIGGGFREGRIGELVAGRTAVLLARAGKRIELVPIRHDPNAAGLLGSIELAPEEMISGFDGILATDIGGTNIAPESSNSGRTQVTPKFGNRSAGATPTTSPSRTK
jgi:hypothetical protein